MPDILLVEDEPNIAEAVRFILSREGWSVALHADGAGVLDVIRATVPRLVILDLMLPNRSGAEILADLRADAALAATPVLMLTARGNAATAAAQADGLLAKPFANADLRALVRRMLI